MERKRPPDGVQFAAASVRRWARRLVGNHLAALPQQNLAMLFPRFTLRTILLVITGSALLFVVVGAAVRGHTWAVGVTAAVVSVLLAAVIHAGWFGIVWLIARLSPAESTGGHNSPPASRPAAGGAATTTDLSGKPS